jgi:hypothetical protein
MHGIRAFYVLAVLLAVGLLVNFRHLCKACNNRGNFDTLT